jgi:hypothetical protein
VINWCVRFSDGRALTGSVEDGSWKNIIQELDKKKHLRIDNFYVNKDDRAMVAVDSDSIGYFLCNKESRNIFGGSTKVNKLLGVGSVLSDNRTVLIRWYDKENLAVVEEEKRGIPQCVPFLAKND